MPVSAAALKLDDCFIERGCSLQQALENQESITNISPPLAHTIHIGLVEVAVAMRAPPTETHLNPTTRSQNDLPLQENQIPDFYFQL